MEGGEGKTESEAEEEARVWSWGAGSDGQLARGTLEDQCFPQPLLNFPSTAHPISYLACGGAHSVALTGHGKVLTWGRGTCGQLGHGELKNCLQPKLVKFFESFTVSYVSAGWNHSGFIADTGHLYMCGDGSFGQLGNGDRQSHDSPVEVPFFVSKHVEQIACGMRHSLALVRESSDSSLYAFGSGRHGQLGMSVPETGRPKSRYLPTAVHGFENQNIVYICANGDQSAALSADGMLYTWGKGFSGSSTNRYPCLLPSSLRFSQVALGWNHALVVADGEAYMLGGSRHGMLSSLQNGNMEKQASMPTGQASSDDSVIAPTLEGVTCIEGERVVGIATGAEHSALVTDKGTIMTWGWGEHGQLGLGNLHDQTRPQIVNIECKVPIPGSQLGVYCGSGFTFVVK